MHRIIFLISGCKCIFQLANIFFRGKVISREQFRVDARLRAAFPCKNLCHQHQRDCCVLLLGVSYPATVSVLDFGTFFICNISAIS